MKKVSFDFDSTLDKPLIQKFAVELMREGFDVHIVTSRPKYWTLDEMWDNSDLFQIAEILNISTEKIHFTDYKPKSLFFEKNEDFLFHLDDDHVEIEQISSSTKVKAILFDEDWKENILSVLKIETKF
jgi:hypothetical protein